MKLIRAQFQNFRMLRDLELDFARDTEKKLTVIRAANESGKTTILHGLQWALYGDAALPNKGNSFRLCPIDWNVSEGQSVSIMATVEFELTTHRQVSGELRESRQRYRLVRSVIEDVDSRSRQTNSTVKLFLLNDTGTTPFDAPEAMINDELPPDLREVFFTDGDRALSFIEADATPSIKRNRVQRAIRSLLGLGAIDAAIKHVSNLVKEVNKKAKQAGSGGELDRVASRLEEIEDKWEKLKDELEDAKQQFNTFDEKVDEIDNSIATALQKGDKEKLQKEMHQAKREIKHLDEKLTEANKEHSTLFRSQPIAIALLESLLNRAFGKLEDLYDQGKIPNATIPVLQDRLSAEVCICGETLELGDPCGETRRTHIQKLIDNSRQADEIQGTLTNLYFEAKSLNTVGNSGSSSWFEGYKTVVERRNGLQTMREKAGREFKALEMQLDKLPDTNIQGLRETLRQYKDQRDRQLSRQSSIETQITALSNEHKELDDERDRLLRAQKKNERILAEFEVAKDVKEVLENAYGQTTNEELRKVSKLMNSIFIEMIGADPEYGAIIQRAEISQEFDIIVYGPNDRTLDPDRDLNGASRRALTLAFILALTKVSEVEAPNVIDTPLGMTSGYVKRSILRTAVRESSQLVLFLTHDEIIGCEEIIDKSAGVVFTLTNSSHYPKMLVNNPGIEEINVLRCNCNHRVECRLCERRPDAQGES